MKKRIVTALLVLVLLAIAAVAVFANGTVDPNEIYLQELDFGGGANPVCPWCGVQPEGGWTALDSDIEETLKLNGHYYLTEDRNNLADYACVAYDACVYIGTHNITATNSCAFQVDSGKTLTIMGQGSITGSHNLYASVGGTIDVGGAGGTLNLCGGTYSKGNDSGCAVLTVRGSASSTVNMYAGTVIENGDSNNYEGGNVRISAPATFRMYGGTISGGKAYCGGNVYMISDGAKFYMHGGTIVDGSAELSDGTLSGKNDQEKDIYALGGNICVLKGQLIQSKGATIRGGKAYTGGNIYYAGGSTVTLEGTVSNGTGMTGGNIDLRSGSTLVLPEGALISNGQVNYDGGNIQIYNATLELQGGKITGGKAVRWGGNILADNGAQVKITEGTITGGQATDAKAGKGGNLFVGNAQLTISGGQITMGVAMTGGGNIYFEKTPYKISIDNCEISYGQASSGGNICVRGADIPEGESQSPTQINIGKDALIEKGKSQWERDDSIAGGGGNIFCNGGIVNIYGRVSGGYANTTGGNLEVRNALVQLQGSAKISGGQAAYDGGNIVVNNRGKLVLDNNSAVTGGTAGRYGENIFTEGWTGLLGSTNVTDHGGIYLAASASLRVYNGYEGNVALSNLELPENIYGAQLDATRFASDSSYTGRLWLAQIEDAPCLFGQNGGLVVGAAYTIKDGAKTWFADNAAAIAGYGEADYLVPGGDLELAGGNYVVDLAGQNITISGKGRVVCFDSSNDTYETYGGAVIDGPVLRNGLAECVNGSYYVRMRRNGVYSFHRIDLKITGVSLRISSGGIYYSAQWKCDKAVAPLVQGFGVGVSLVDMPKENLRYDSDTMHTLLGASEFTSGVQTNGVLVRDILRDSASAEESRVDKNSTYAKMPIYAKAYVILDNGVDRVQTVVSNDDIAMSMHDVLASIERNMPHYYSSAKNLQSFQNHWAQNGLDGAEWDFDFTVPVEIVKLQQHFDGAQIMNGQIHDRLEETADLSAWKTQMQESGIDFAACLESGTVSYIGSDAWDDTAFVGGIEATFKVDGKTVDCSMLFATKADLEAVLTTSGAFTYANNTFTTKTMTGATFGDLVAAVRSKGGVFVLAHPKQIGLIESQDPMDYWFADQMTVDIGTSEQNYKLWTDLLNENKRVYAISANAGQLTGQADSLTLYAAQENAQGILAELVAGDYTCGPVGMKLLLGDTEMGGVCSFTGNKLAVGVDQAAAGVLQADHSYRIDLITKSGVKQSWSYNGRAVYELVDADPNQAFYRLELVDETTGQPIAISNPIWNDDYGLKVGFAREDITPNYEVLIVGGDQRISKGRKADDDGIFLTCVAVQEGEQTYLVFTADLINASSSYYTAAFKDAVAAATGIPKPNISFSTTHTHSSVGANNIDWSFLDSELGSGVGAKNRDKFLEDLNEAGVRVAEAAIADLTAVEAAYTGSVTGKKDVAFVRHYVKKNGALDYSNEGGYEVAGSLLEFYWNSCQYTAHATDADNEIQLVKFQRTDGKKDVVFMSVPAHATLNENDKYLSADFPNYARRYIERETESLVAYFIGAAGDQVPRSKLSNYYLNKTIGVSNNTDAKKYGEKLGSYAVTVLNGGNMTPLRSTALKLTGSVYNGQIGDSHLDEASYEQAKAFVVDYNQATTETAKKNVNAAIKKAGFLSYDDVRYTVYRYERVYKNANNPNFAMSINIKTMAIGDLGFVLAPYEMAGVNGTQIKNGSPYTMTFIASCTDDAIGYVASQDAFDHGSYEAQCTWFAPGSGELLVKQFIEVLEQQKYNLK